jgi:hypothetical protein
MNELSKQQIEEKYGKYGVFNGPINQLLISKVHYMNGIPPFDRNMNGKLVNKNIIYFKMRPKGFEIELAERFFNSRVCFDFNQLNYFVLEAQPQVFEQKSKSIIGRALLGGVLLGPVGAIVGGITGVGDKKLKKEDFPDNALTISITDLDGTEKFLLFAVDNKNLKDVTVYIRQNFPIKIKTALEVEKLYENETSPNSSQLSVADELIKLKSLLDAEILTIDEFKAQKNKLLGI